MWGGGLSAESSYRNTIRDFLSGEKGKNCMLVKQRENSSNFAFHMALSCDISATKVGLAGWEESGKYGVGRIDGSS